MKIGFRGAFALASLTALLASSEFAATLTFVPVEGRTQIRLVDLNGNGITDIVEGGLFLCDPSATVCNATTGDLSAGIARPPWRGEGVEKNV